MKKIIFLLLLVLTNSGCAMGILATELGGTTAVGVMGFKNSRGFRYTESISISDISEKERILERVAEVGKDLGYESTALSPTYLQLSSGTSYGSVLKRTLSMGIMTEAVVLINVNTNDTNKKLEFSILVSGTANPEPKAKEIFAKFKNALCLAKFPATPTTAVK